jgi:hypothetical protein
VHVAFVLQRARGEVLTAHAVDSSVHVVDHRVWFASKHVRSDGIVLDNALGFHVVAPIFDNRGAVGRDGRGRRPHNSTVGSEGVVNCCVDCLEIGSIPARRKGRATRAKTASLERRVAS